MSVVLTVIVAAYMLALWGAMSLKTDWVWWLLTLPLAIVGALVITGVIL